METAKEMITRIDEYWANYDARVGKREALREARRVYEIKTEPFEKGERIL